MCFLGGFVEKRKKKSFLEDFQMKICCNIKKKKAIFLEVIAKLKTKLRVTRDCVM